MQKFAPKVFIYSSIAFGVMGIGLVLTMPGPGGDSSTLNMTFLRLLFVCGFIVLPSFALSVASKYLNGKS